MKLSEIRKRFRKVSQFLPKMLGHILWLSSWEKTKEIREKILKAFQHSGRGFPNSLGEGVALRPAIIQGHRAANRAPDFFLLLSTVGHFGNLAIQLANAVALARLGGSETVFFDSSALGFGRWRPEPRAFDIRSLQGHIGLNVDLKELAYEDIRRFKEPSLLWRSNAMKGQEVFLDLRSQDAEVLRSSLVEALGSPEIPTRSDKTATIHLRSGDIFGPNPHPRYGQPPWAFYKKILEESGPWDEIRLVAEDASNPVETKIKEWAQYRGVPLIHTGRSFRSAIEEIATSSTLLTSNSTFLPSITFLYPRARNIYLFESRPHAMLVASGGTLIGVRDRRGLYREQVFRRNWKNSPAQRRLMLGYPEVNLEFTGLQGVCER